MKQITFYSILITVLLFYVELNDCFARGGGGTYFLTGQALLKTGDTLKNEQIIVYFKNKVDTLQTDSDGFYKIKIRWMTVCPSGVKVLQRIRANNQINPMYIFFSFKDTKIKIRNDWKNFASNYFDNPESRTKKQNLVFKIKMVDTI